MKTAWNNHSAAVSLTFDDGMQSHLDVAIPILDARNLRGTFYLNPTGDDDGRTVLEAFRPALEAGHELGNHTIRHPCSCAGGIKSQAVIQGCLEQMTLEAMAAELDDADRRFRAAFPHVEAWGFAYPCYNTFVGRGRARCSYVPLVAERFVYARAGGEMSKSFNKPPLMDLACLYCWKCERRTADDMIALVERTVEAEAWSLFIFHGIDEGHLPVAEDAFCELAAYLDTHRDRIWTAPAIEVARCVVDS